MTTGTTVDVSQLNSLLRGEVSAVETYKQALDMLNTEPGAQELHSLKKEHLDAADSILRHVEKHGGKPAEGSGAWGAWAKMVQGTSKLFGNAAALKALKEGEEHGLKDYQSALEDKDLDAECQALIRGLIARQQAHITVLDRLISQQ